MFVTTINSKTKVKPYTLLITKKNELPEITIIDAKTSYLCRISQETISKFAKIFEVTPIQYTETLWTLLNEDATSNGLMDIVKNEFVLYKQSSIKYIISELREINHVEALQLCMNHLLSKSFQQNDEIARLTRNNAEIAKDLTTYKAKLDECIDNASERETRLYACFVQLLNEKKKYIQHMRNFIDNKDLEKVERSKSKGRQAKRRRVDMSSSSSDGTISNGYNTDEEGGVESTKSVRDEASEASSGAAGTSNIVGGGLDARLLDSDSGSDSNEIFLTALPPRIGRKEGKEDVVNANNSSTVKVINQSADSMANNKGDVKRAQVEEIMNTTPDTPMETFSTQDLIDGI